MISLWTGSEPARDFQISTINASKSNSDGKFGFSDPENPLELVRSRFFLYKLGYYPRGRSPRGTFVLAKPNKWFVYTQNSLAL